jgi:SagB-type dehydrogenase family enzyme
VYLVLFRQPSGVQAMITRREKTGHRLPKSGIILLLIFSGIGLFLSGGKAMQNQGQNRVIKLPAPQTDGGLSFESALHKRRSVRSFTERPVSLSAVAQLLWAAQGVTHQHGLRTAPSAGALYPLEVFVVAGNVTGLEAGLYHYRPSDHVLVQIGAGDQRAILVRDALGQSAIFNAPVDFVIAGMPGRTTGKYGNRGVRYMYMEAGHAAQNLCLQAVALELDSVVIGAFSDQKVGNMLQLGSTGIPIYIIPVGRKD